VSAVEASDIRLSYTNPAWTGTYRIVRRGPRNWWALPNDPSRDTERGPCSSERAARAGMRMSGNSG
jgi:hypothetical protein